MSWNNGTGSSRPASRIARGSKRLKGSDHKVRSRLSLALSEQVAQAPGRIWQTDELGQDRTGTNAEPKCSNKKLQKAEKRREEKRRALLLCLAALMAFEARSAFPCEARQGGGGAQGGAQTLCCLA